MNIHIDTQGMTDTEKTVALITEILDHIEVKRKRKKAKEIREENRITDKKRKKSKNCRKVKK